jgi:formylglycine-generating enzyme required for sulfatase activity
MAIAVLTVLTHDHVTSDVKREAALHVPAPSRPWILVAGKFWEIDSGQSEDPSVTDAAEGTRGSCPPGMVEVRGSMKVDGDRGSVEFFQDLACTDWISRQFPERCARFDEQTWLETARDLPVKPLHFCIDRYEYPNRRGAYPVIAVTWHEAGAACRERGERLCTEDEWTFACEGEEALPYPNGFARDSSACVLDKPWKLFDAYRLAVRDSTLAVAEIDYAWQGEPSGARPRCRSPFGVYDTTGNVDEWTQSVRNEGYPSILKGGYWGPVRARCRASTRAHNEDFYFYQQGFRCCADAPASERTEVANP